MTFFEVFLYAFPVIMTLMTLLWLISVLIKNASIVDAFWGIGFLVAAGYYFWAFETHTTRNYVVLGLVAIWSLRLFFYLSIRNWGKAEDFRYQQFRKDYGEHRYWWVSFFQTFLLQGTLMWLVSSTILGAMYSTASLGLIDYMAILLFTIGFVFEAGGDYQLARFKSNPANQGKVLDSGFWKYTRHPNYFGDACLWWGFALFAVSAGNYLAILGSLIMTFLLLRISGVSLLEKSLKKNKPGYADYVRKTAAFIPWFPRP